MDHSVVETALAQQLKRHTNVTGQERIAATHYDRRDEQVTLVNEPGPDRVRGEGGTAHRNIRGDWAFEFPDHLWIEFSFEPRLRSVDRTVLCSLGTQQDEDRPQHCWHREDSYHPRRSSGIRRAKARHIRRNDEVVRHPDYAAD